VTGGKVSGRALRIVVVVATRSVLLAAGLGCELFAALAVWHGRGAIALALHSAASACVGLLAAADSCECRERWLRFGCGLLLASSLPGLGALGVLLALLPIWWRSDGSKAPALLEVSRPDWSDSSQQASEHAERLLARLSTPKMGTPSERVQLLLAQRGMPAVAAVPGLRSALRDASEEVRLLAHALLDRRETRLRAEIARAEAELTVARSREMFVSDPLRLVQLQRVLAHLYWGLVEGELAPGELGREALGHVRWCAQQALATRECGELCLLLARVCLRESDGLGAWHWLQRSERAGVPRESRARLYAEAAFLLGRFEQVAHWLECADARQQCRPNLSRAASNWLRD
jgi:hypothetical protein